MFWQLHFDHNPALSKLADRILYTLANLIPCERSFSALNVLYTKLHNALTVERVDKLLYFQINRRTLRREAEFEVLEEDEDDTMQETSGDVEQVEDAPGGFSEDELV
jgi:hypothetical protein